MEEYLFLECIGGMDGSLVFSFLLFLKVSVGVTFLREMGYVNKRLRVQEVNEKNGFSVGILVNTMDTRRWRLALSVLELQGVNLF